MFHALRWLVPLVACSVAAQVAHAHINMKSPAHRAGGTLKAGPCGGAVKGASPTVLEPGATITVTWDETIQHPGHFRVAFDVDGDDFPMLTGFDDVKAPLPFDLGNGASVLVDNIADKTGPIFGNTPYEQVVTLPDVECETCTLQLIQVMTDKPPYTMGGDDIYYECADLALRRIGGVPDAGVLPTADAGLPPPVAGMVAPPPVAGMVAPPPTAGTGGMAGMTGIGGTTPLPPVTPAPMANSSDSGGCSVTRRGATGAANPLALTAIALAVGVLVQRRHRLLRAA